ncbi:Xaa-Pro peptidase family protein [Bacillus sp. FJAT-29790]|uniref:M24 family metallopeptidase n=1 Tax=Bacillus sp. FJAT-29790 TaxID=1895002 RepID=UPI001C22FF68|nr:Xaa-Pro peptidase family protein [Bacillus sp. FJAT-29790]MBU8880681.1 Xaa-Pro peptidase family protein [Bacillus sp. FJAT-29790]
MQSQYKNRIDSLIRHLENQQIDLAIITSPKNVFYYTGFNSEPYERFMAVVIDLKKQNQYLFVPALDQEVAEEHSYIKRIVTVSDELNPYQILKKTVGESVKVIGLETKNVSLFQQEQLNHYFSDFSYKNIGDFISGQRMRKTPEECSKVQHAIQVIEKVLGEGIKTVRDGMTELDLVAEFEYLMRKFGAEGPSFSTTVLSGAKASLPHGSPNRKKMIKGDFLLIDMGVIVDGYCSDITRTFVIGEETEKQREIYEIVRKATQEGVNASKAGVPIGTFDIAARNVIKEAGYGQYFNNRVGHGLGIDVHEEPSIHENNQLIAESGLLFTIEPGIYIPGFGGVRIEENVYIGEDGKANLLTTFPTELIRIG